MKIFRWLAAPLLAVLALPLGAQTPTIVASTSWTAALARAAGATEVVILAPAELKHPPEYEIKPSDLEAVRGAKLVVYGGYEKFAKRLAETAGSVAVPTLVLTTTNVPIILTTQVKRVAEALGTGPVAVQWAQAYEAASVAARARVQAAFPDKRAVVQVQFKAVAEWLGFEVVGVFGPGELSPAIILEQVKAKPALVIDNYHNPSGPAVAEATGAKYVQLINFPGKDGTKSLEDVLSYNERQLVPSTQR